LATQIALIVGQSNALGYQVTPAELPGWYAPDARVQIWTGSGFATMQPGVNTGTPANPTAWGPEVGYAAAWLADPANAGQTLYVVKSVKGSTGLAADAGADDWSPSSTGELFDATTAKVTAAKAALTGPFHTVALWFQGGEDATSATKSAAYASNLANLKTAAATSWGVDDFQYGRISTSLAYNDVVQAAQPDGFATDYEPKQLDGLHFTGAAQIDHGAEFYAQLSVNTLAVATGGAGDDRYVGSLNADSVSAGSGDDAVYGGPGDDWLHGNMGADSLSGGAGADTMYGGQNDDRIFGGDGDDWLNANLGADLAYGGNGNDTMYGGQDNDTLNGGVGNDWLAGDRGDDLLTGGTGADTFYFVANPGDHDTVTDFSYADGDRIQLMAGETYTAAQVGADVVVTLGGGSDFTLVGVNLASLGTGWVI
jgi:Ca2+-binding RTX toxin-like protein